MGEALSHDRPPRHEMHHWVATDHGALADQMRRCGRRARGPEWRRRTGGTLGWLRRHLVTVLVVAVLLAGAASVVL